MFSTSDNAGEGMQEKQEDRRRSYTGRYIVHEPSDPSMPEIVAKNRLTHIVQARGDKHEASQEGFSECEG